MMMYTWQWITVFLKENIHVCYILFETYIYVYIYKCTYNMVDNTMEWIIFQGCYYAGRDFAYEYSGYLIGLGLGIGISMVS